MNKHSIEYKPLMQHECSNWIPIEGMITAKDPMEYHKCSIMNKAMEHQWKEL